MTRRHRLIYLVVALCCGSALLAHVDRRVPVPIDYQVYHLAGRIVLDPGASLYTELKKPGGGEQTAEQAHVQMLLRRALRNSEVAHSGIDLKLFEPGFVLPYFYPPLLAYAVYPLSGLTVEQGGLIWRSLLLAMVIALPFLIAGRFPEGSHEPHFATAALALAVFAPAIVDNLGFGQCNIPMAFFLTLSVAQMERRPWLAGVALGVAGLIKFTPGIFLFYFLFRWKWRVLAGAALFALVFFAGTVALGGMHHWFDFVRALPEVSSGERIMKGIFPADTVGNLSLRGFFARVVSGGALSTVLAYGTSLLLLGYALVRAVGERRRGDQFAVRLFFRLGILSLLMSPMTWLHHAIVLYPCLMALLWLDKSHAQVGMSPGAYQGAARAYQEPAAEPGRQAPPAKGSPGVLVWLFFVAMLPLYHLAEFADVVPPELWRVRGLLGSWNTYACVLLFFAVDLLYRSEDGTGEIRLRAASGPAP